MAAHEVGDLAAERVDAVFEALIEHVADHDHAALRPLTHAAEIRVIELGLRAVATLKCAEQGRYGIAADPMAPCQVINNLEPFGAEFLHSYRLRGAGMEALLVFRDVHIDNDAAYPRGGSGFHGVTAGTSHGPGISTVPKLAGPATSRYSMSFE
ncbi:MAG: hypothetical protein USCAAHI_00967 [Beijerinckiaceae bacterium]|nr:MAG: hypothetical protein USCAAHI_00967 [Beijerinckiaceae bacterium]